MTYAEALTYKAALEAADLASPGVVSVSIGSRAVSYATAAQARSALAEINRSIQAYNRRANGQNPFVSNPRWP